MTKVVSQIMKTVKSIPPNVIFLLLVLLGLVTVNAYLWFSTGVDDSQKIISGVEKFEDPYDITENFLDKETMDNMRNKAEDMKSLFLKELRVLATKATTLADVAEKSYNLKKSQIDSSVPTLEPEMSANIPDDQDILEAEEVAEAEAEESIETFVDGVEEYSPYSMY